MIRSSAVVIALVAVVQLVACESPASEAPPSGAAAPTGATSPPPTLSAEGYLYTSKEGVRALATFGDDGSALEVENTTGATLGPPGLYLLDARTGEVIGATVSPRRGLRDGDRREYAVTLDRTPAPGGIGLVVLTIAGEDLGAFLPPAAQGDAG